MTLEASNMNTVDEQPLKLGGKKSDLAYDALKRAIVLRQYEPGLQIMEQAVASEFQCSQSTVREALWYSGHPTVGHAIHRLETGTRYLSLPGPQCHRSHLLVVAELCSALCRSQSGYFIG